MSCLLLLACVGQPEAEASQGVREEKVRSYSDYPAQQPINWREEAL